MPSCHGSHQSHPPALRLQFRGAPGPLPGRGPVAPRRERAPGERQRLPQVCGSARRGAGWAVRVGARSLHCATSAPGDELTAERHTPETRSGPARAGASLPGTLLTAGGRDLEQLGSSRPGLCAGRVARVPHVPQTRLLWAALGAGDQSRKKG